ncbi:MAG: stage 0 sporulation family protein [Ruminococcus sp.]|nr:stage 0 sporulation family protein [Ruminococcus sp.]MCR5075700.1 stage 0 sporulation family protein [Ruminococcus sp.]
MKEIVGIRFKSVGKIYYFSPGDIRAKVGDHAIVETVRGVECGEVVIANRQIEDNSISSPLKPIIRLADANDMKTVAKNKQKEKDAFKICEEKIAFRKLKMNLVDVECTFDNNKLLFYFTAENRVDFRELVKDLAAVFRTRIELRQIGVRDEAKILGGLGICGREFCCKAHMGDFNPVSIKMAKEQGLSLNPTKISGTCGRLMCCLKNEQAAYESLLKITPKVGAVVVTPDGDKGRVEDVNLITGKLRIKTEKSEVPVTLDRSEVKLLKDAEVKLSKEELKALKNLEDK